MGTSDFARKYGYVEEHWEFESPDHLPEELRSRVGMMMLDQFEGLSNWLERFVEAVQSSLPDSRDLLKWYDSIPLPRNLPDDYPFELDGDEMQLLLTRPLMDCDWRLFYAIVENVCADWDRTGSTRAARFAPKLNRIFRSHRIPWELHSGKVIPVADSEFAENLQYVRQALSSLESDDSNDPHVLLKDALDALYRKQGGPDIAAACVNAWGAWKAAAAEVSGYGARDNRAFEFVKSNYPKLHDTMNAWQKLAESGRHPESEGSPNESETRFIVMLCVNAVRFLGSTRADAADAHRRTDN